MRCVKCGYVSFDYLSECKKCSTSLTVARNDLGFFGAKPAFPSLLGSLLGNYEPSAQPENIFSETESLPSFSFPEQIDDAPPQEKTENQETPSAAINFDLSEEDFSLLDLSDEELELLIDKESLGSGEDAALQQGLMDDNGGRHPGLPSAGEFPAPVMANSPFESDTTSAAGPSADELDFSLDDYPLEIEDKTELFSAFEPAPEFIGNATEVEQRPEAPAGFKADTQQSRPQLDDPTNDFVIELSENDLETLLEELGTTVKGAD